MPCVRLHRASATVFSHRAVQLQEQDCRKKGTRAMRFSTEVYATRPYNQRN